MTLLQANAWLALIGALLLTDVVANMDARTCHAVRCGVVLLFAGLFGDFLSLWLFGWGQYIATFQLIGLIMFIGADRRHTTLTFSTLFRSRNRRE